MEADVALFIGVFFGMLLGPVIGNEEGFGDIRTSLAVGTFVVPEGQTPMDILQERMGADGSAVDHATLEETTMAGYTAVVFRGPRQPWTHRKAFVGVDGMIYTIVAQPEEPERFAEGMPYLEEVWDMGVESLGFSRRGVKDRAADYRG